MCPGNSDLSSGCQRAFLGAVAREKACSGQSWDRNVSISLIGHESLELVPGLVFSFKGLDPKDSTEFSFSEKSLWFKGPLRDIKRKPGLELFDIWEGKSSRAARSQASSGARGFWAERRRLPLRWHMAGVPTGFRLAAEL